MYHRVSFLEIQLRNLHVIANLFWIGSIVSVGLLVTLPLGAARERGALARALYTKLAVPAFLISFLAAAVRLVSDLNYYFVATHWMHAKLPLALGVIALHHVLGARARRLADGSRKDGGPAGVLTAVLAVLAVGSAWLALGKPF
jgi:protoporphyrinogen IX oxidase